MTSPASQFVPARRRRRRRSHYSLLALLALLATLLMGSGVPAPRAALASAPLPLEQAQAAAPAALMEQGQQDYAAGRYAAAATAWQQAADGYAAAGQPVAQARSLSNVALARQQLGQWEAAAAAIAAGLAGLETAPPSPERTQALAQSWTARGSLALAQSQATAATEAFTTAATYYQASGDRAGELRSRINQGRSLQAGGYYRRAIALLQAIQPPLEQQQSAEAAAGLRTLGDLYRAVGDLEAAQTALTQSLAIAQASGDAEGIAAAQFGLGNTAAVTSPGAAQGWYRQVVDGNVSPTLTVQARVAQIELWLATEEDTAIRAQLPALQDQLAALPPGRLRTYAYIDLASALTAAPTSPYRRNAADLLAIALQAAEQLGDLRAESFAAGTLGRLYQQSQQWPEAIALTERALERALTARAPDISYRWNAQLGQLKQQTGKPQEAIDHYAAAVNTLQGLRRDLVAVGDDVRFGFRETVEPVYRQLVELLTASPDASQEQLQQALGVIESLQLAELENFFREACLVADPRQIDQVDTTAAVIYPILLQGRLEVVLSLPGQPLKHYPVPVDKATVDRTLDQLLRGISLRSWNLAERSSQARGATIEVETAEPGTAPPTVALQPPDYREPARQLYDWLIRPLETELADTHTLVFVLDSTLRNVPMSVLFDGEQYLIQKYAIALTPGLQLLDPKPLAQRRVQALVAGLSQARSSFPALPNVQTEVEAIAAQVPSQVLLNETFSSATFSDRLATAPFPVVHLATHGKFGETLEDTFVLTWDGQINANQLSGLLQRSEISRDGAIELLVLSACETAAGDDRAALGLAGVAVRSGARSTLATLWLVDDRGTSLLMEDLYQQLATTSQTKAEVLRQAQLRLLASDEYSHPYFWAPFVLIGNWL